MKSKNGGRIAHDIARALSEERKAAEGFERMPPSHQEEFLRYILEARRPETRARRIVRSVEAIKRWYAARQKKERQR